MATLSYTTTRDATKYAARRGFDIVRTYADEGRSGLNIAGRESLKSLIDDAGSMVAGHKGSHRAAATCADGTPQPLVPPPPAGW